MPTALAVQALQEYRNYTGVNAALSKARQWLAAQKKSDQSWGRADNTAQALLALLPAQINASAYAGTITHLESTQRADGSWLDDAYVTAVVLRALSFSGQPVTNPDLATITGILLDSQTRAPLAGVAVNLEGVANVSVTTDTAGAFAFDGLTVGSYALVIPAQGEFAALRAEIVLAVGQKLDAGLVLLNRNTSPATATVLGKITRADTGAPVAGVVVKAGALSVTTGADGSYQMFNVPPGDTTLSASYTGFHGAAGKVTLQAGSTAIFSPALVPMAANASAGAISGVVVDALTGSPVPTATVTVSGAFTASVQTDASGGYAISPIQPGEITLVVSAGGYQDVTASAVVESNSLLSFSPKLVPSGGVAGAGRIHGLIVDAATNLPLEDVQVNAGSGLSVMTGTDGSYVIHNVPVGVVRITASKAGYASASGEANMPANGLMEFSPKLTPATTGLTSSAVFGVVKSAKDGTPVANAEVYLSGMISHSAQTDANGHYRIDGLAAGNYSVTVSHEDFSAASANFDLSTLVEMEFSPLLSDAPDGSAIIPNSTTLSGRLIDSTSNRVIDSATYRLGAETRERGVNRFGRFNILGITDATVEVTFTAEGYHPLVARFPVTPLVAQDVGDLYMDRVIAARMPDLAVAQFDVSGAQVDQNTLTVSGQARIEVVNQGAQDTRESFSVLVFEDVDSSGRYEPGQDQVLGTANISAGLQVGEVKAATVVLTGTLRFRDAPLALWVDSSNQVLELDEDNNLDRYGTSPKQVAKLYTDKADFDEGQAINVSADATGNALQLAEDVRAFNNIWIANSGRGTVLKVDINTGDVLGEYRSAPAGRGTSPSRTTVDKNGNVWVANRNEGSYVAANAIAPGLPATQRGMGSIIKIGLLENGQWAIFRSCR